MRFVQTVLTATGNSDIFELIKKAYSKPAEDSSH
jgi:hypothetical protein